MKPKNKKIIRIKAFLMRCLCFKKRRMIDPKKVSSILVLRYDRIGDMVVTTPLFRALREGFPEAKIAVLASPSNAKVVEYNPNINEVYVFPKSILGRLLVLRKLRRKNFSLIVDLEHNLIWHIIFHIRLINPKWVVSSFKFDRYGVKPASLGLFNLIADIKPSVTMTEIYLGISQALGIPRREGDLRYQLICSDANNNYAKEVLGEKRGLFVGINLFGSKKGWEIRAEDCLTICREILAKHKNLKIFLFSTMENFSLIEAIFEEMNLPSVVLLKPTSDVMDAAAVISKLDLLVTPDTSFSHIACAFDVPLVAVNPKSEVVFKNWRPLHPSSRAKVIFSKDEKSLKGYSYLELKNAVESFL